MPTNVRKMGLAALLDPDEYEDPRANPYADEPQDPPPDPPAPAPVGDLGLAGLLKKPLGVEPLDGFEGATRRTPEIAVDWGSGPDRAVEIEVEPPTIRPERGGGAPVANPPPSATAAPPGRFGMGRMVPMVPGRPAAPPPARAPLRPAPGASSPEVPAAGGGRSALLELLGSQRHDQLVSDANSVGDALLGAFTRTRPAPARGTDMGGQFGARRQLQEQELDADPTSERSRSLQALVDQLLPGTIRPEDLPKLSRKQLLEMLPVMTGLEKSRAQRQAAIDKAAADRKNKLTDLGAARENKLSDIESSRDYQYERDQRNYAAAKERAQIMAGAKQAAAGDKSLEDLAKRMPPEAAALLVKLDKMSKLIGGIDPNAKGDISGIGPAEGRVPDWAEPYVIDEEGQDVRQLAKGVTAMLLKMQSGTAASEGEVRRKMTELGMAPGSTSRQFRTGLTNLRDEMGASLRHQAAGFSPETVKRFHEQGGVTAEDIERLGKSPTVKVRHKPSGRVKELSGAAAERALADPDFEEAR